MRTIKTRRLEEYRRCPLCRAVLSPGFDTARDDDGNTIPFVLSRRYDCSCGYHCRILALPSVVGLGLVGTIASGHVGRAYFHGELESAWISVVMMVAVMGALTHNIWLRLRCPRVR